MTAPRYAICGFVVTDTMRPRQVSIDPPRPSGESMTSLPVSRLLRVYTSTCASGVAANVPVAVGSAMPRILTRTGGADLLVSRCRIGEHAVRIRHVEEDTRDLGTHLFEVGRQPLWIPESAQSKER